jgi:hypothetical protein
MCEVGYPFPVSGQVRTVFNGFKRTSTIHVSVSGLLRCAALRIKFEKSKERTGSFAVLAAFPLFA